ncbi:MAG: serine protease [Chloroflexi bacterium]|nr:serine protease [Chloroflexota bacterium]MDA1218853.1 serine protease [Chloroflexota bacterium]
MVVGTGFYISRYGLFMSAKHVLETLINESKANLDVGYVCHRGVGNTIHLRRIRRVSFLNPQDIAVGQADNYVEQFPKDPLRNMRVKLTTDLPLPGDSVITYAYPQNEILDFTRTDAVPVIAGDYFQGEFIRSVDKSDHPFMQYPYFETTIKLRSGASGGPVFDSKGRVIGINCRGWDFGVEDEGTELSSMVPVSAALDLKCEPLQLPSCSWEASQIPEGLELATLTIRDLAKFGHIHYDPQIS